MAQTQWGQRFFTSTRGRVVNLLRRASHTVDELAQALGLTDNAVRAHLATLERDGLVHQQGVRRGPGKPSYAYELTPEADALFPKAYGPVLRQLLDVLAARLEPQQVHEIMGAVGRRIAASGPLPTGDLPTRLEAAVGVLADLGGLAEIEEQDGRLFLRGYSCPLAAAVPGHPEACHLAETLLGEVIGRPVVECCARTEPPRCCFEVLNTEESDDRPGSI